MQVMLQNAPTHGQEDMSRVSFHWELKASSWKAQHQLDDKAFEHKSGPVDRESEKVDRKSGHGFTDGLVQEEYLGGCMVL